MRGVDLWQCEVAAERLFTVDNPLPKPGLNVIARSELKRAGVRVRDLAKDALAAMKGYG